MKNKLFHRRKFDFEIGYLIKSPCKQCFDRHRLPKCMDECKKLDAVRTILAPGVSCSKYNTSLESFAFSSEGWKK